MFSRRKFMERLGMFFAGSVVSATGQAKRDVPGRDRLVEGVERKLTARERAKALAAGSLARDFDLVVVGGGISGVSAAISAARCGLKVALVHNRSMFGGNSSSEVKLFPEDNSATKPWIKEGGLNEEFHTEERVRNHDEYREGVMNCHWDLVLYEWVIREKNITPFLNTHMHRVFMKDASRIDSIFAIQLGTEKSYTLSAPLFLDATGDGVLTALAGAEFRWGREARSEYGESLAPEKADEKVMGNTLMFTARDTGGPVPFKRPDWTVEFPTEKDLYSRGHSVLRGGYWWIEVGAPYHPIADNNETAHEGLRQLLGVWDHIKNRCTREKEKAANYGLDFVGFWPYKRAGRRIVGDYVLTQRDIQDPKPLDDAVAYGAWNIDMHVQGGILARDKQSYPPPDRAENWQDICTMIYPIPIRSLYSKNVVNLLAAGRPISASYLAFCSSRVLCTGSICGQAAGIVAAVARKNNVIPRQVAKEHAKEVQQTVLRHDGHIPGVINTDERDLARHARAKASSEARLVFPPPNNSRDLKFPHAQLFPVTADRVDTVSLLLKSERKTPVRAKLGLRPAASVWDFRGEKDIASAEADVPPGESWVVFHLNAKVEPGKLYYVHLPRLKGVSWRSYRDENGKPSQVPVGTTPSVLPDKTPYSKKSTTFRENFPDVELKDIPGAGTQGHWKAVSRGQSLCMKLTPESAPYGAQNVVTGTNRPDLWTNLWQSDPASPLPASLELEWDHSVEFNQVQLTFNTDQTRRVTLPLFRYPECVRDYRIEFHDGAGWKPLVEESGNYVRRRVHDFKTVRGKRLRVTVAATNGAPYAGIYEIRVYKS